MINGFATMPRLSSPSYHSDVGGPALHHSMSVNAETSSHGSLENLRLSDSEVNMAFRRDNPGRISITKKSEFPSSPSSLACCHGEEHVGVGSGSIKLVVGGFRLYFETSVRRP